MEYFRTRFNDETLVVRDVEPRDVEPLVDYWQNATPQWLAFLGVPADNLGTRDDTRARFRSLIRRDEEAQDRFAWCITLNDRVVGYLNAHLVSPEENYVHAHAVASDVRGLGLGSLLFVRVLRLLFANFSIERLTLQTRPTNVPINRLIQKFGLVPKHLYLRSPDGGLAREGEFNVYELTSEDLAQLKDPLDELA